MVLIYSTSEARVVDFPDPVAPVTSMRPCFFVTRFKKAGEIPSSFGVGILSEIRLIAKEAHRAS